MNDEISMADKRRILAEQEISSYRAHAQANADFDLGGRFALVQKPANVIGSGPVSYPTLPQDAPSNQLAMMPDEPPLGIDINAMDPVGEVFEQEASRSPAKPAWRRI